MITKNDVMLLLVELRDSGEDVQADMIDLYNSPNIPLATLRKIDEKRPLELRKFYDKLRKSYNQKHSKLYINIMKADERPNSTAPFIISTLTGLLNQINNWKAEDPESFLRQARAAEISQVLTHYYKNSDLTPAFNLLHLIKADIITLEYISRHRN